MRQDAAEGLGVPDPDVLIGRVPQAPGGLGFRVQGLGFTVLGF